MTKAQELITSFNTLTEASIQAQLDAIYRLQIAVGDWAEKATKAKQPIAAASQKALDLAQSLVRLMDEYNKLKKKQDAAFEKEDVDSFEDYHFKIKTLVHSTNLFTVGPVVLRNKRWLKIVTPIRQESIKKYTFIKRALDNGEKWLKKAKMTPAQRMKSQRASANMKSRWME